MISGRSFADLVSSLGGKLDLVGLLGMTEDDAVKPVVILKLSEYSEVETLAYISAIAATLSVGRATRILEPGFIVTRDLCRKLRRKI